MTGGAEPAGLAWWKSSYSDAGADCVETAVLPDRRIALRHSKQPDGALLLYTPAEWRAFITGVKAGEFDPA
jgi:predicted secreted Zn-dependent protease